MGRYLYLSLYQHKDSPRRGNLARTSNAKRPHQPRNRRLRFRYWGSTSTVHQWAMAANLVFLKENETL